MKTNSPILYPNVTRVPSSNEAGELKKTSGGDAPKEGEFKNLLNERLQSQDQNVLRQPAVNVSGLQNSLNSASQGLKFSAHASQRLRERQIQLDPDTLARMNDAINKADAKGVQDTLVLTSNAAMIVSVPNRTVITAMDRNALEGNVFTNIDGAVIV